MQLMCCEIQRAEPRADLIEQPRQYECQRFNCPHLVIEIQRFPELPDLWMRIKRPRPNSAREFMQANAFLTETLGNLHRRKFCECSESSNTPAFESFQNFRRH